VFSFFFGCDIVLFLYCTRLRSLIIIIFPMVGSRRHRAGDSRAGDGVGGAHLEMAGLRWHARGGGLEAAWGEKTVRVRDGAGQGTVGRETAMGRARLEMAGSSCVG